MSMAISIGDAERERHEANDELENARAQAAVLTVRINELMTVVSGWDAIAAKYGLTPYQTSQL